MDMKLSLAGRVAIVTGGSKGIGRQISLAMAAEGVKVVVAARGMASIEETCSLIKSTGGDALGIQVDVTSVSQVKHVVQQTLERYGKLDFLINNAGGASKYGSFQECLEVDWLDSFKLNVMGCVNFVQAAESALLLSSQARILTVSSITGLQPGYFNPHYSITKAATINLSKHLANIYAEKGICCNVICAGPVHSDAWNSNVTALANAKSVSFGEAYSELEAQEKKKIPLGRIGEPEDVAAMVVFLLSEKANWITGSCFHVSGGKYSAMS
jgi:3-oxoacyl-[acyl-carrier protein] reductase